MGNPQKQSVPQGNPSTGPNRKPFPWWSIAVLLGLATFALYWPALHCDFINYDDPDYVTANLPVQHGLTFSNLHWAFVNIVSANWHPVTILSHMLDCQLYGLNPWGHHLISICLHTLNTVLVFVWLRQLTGATWRSFFVAALFGLHPLRVESVAWISERKDVLSGLFGLLALIFYCRYARKQSTDATASARRSGLDYALTAVFLTLGLMSKPMLMTWPLVMGLLDFWPLNRVRPGATKRLVLEKLPFLALALVTCLITIMVQKQGGAMALGDTITFGSRSKNALISYVDYLGKIFWPSDLAILYPYPGVWPVGLLLGAGVLLAAIFTVAWWIRRSQPFLLTGWLWYCGTLVPVIGLVQVGAQAMADRYTYLPSLGIMIAIVWGAAEIARRTPGLTIPFSTAGVVALLACCILTRHQLGYWQDSETLFRHTLQVISDNYYAHNNLGTALFAKGQADGAITEYREALRIKPDYGECHNNLGAALDVKEQFADAIAEYREALRYRPDAADIHHALGVDLGKTGQTGEAITELQKTLQLQSQDAMAHNDLGNIYDQTGRTDDAINEYLAAIRLNPDAEEAHGNLGAALARKGKLPEAILELQTALKLNPNDVAAHYNLAAALDQSDRKPEAINELKEALRLNPDFTPARNLLGTLTAP